MSSSLKKNLEITALVQFTAVLNNMLSGGVTLSFNNQLSAGSGFPCVQINQLPIADRVG